MRYAAIVVALVVISVMLTTTAANTTTTQNPFVYNNGGSCGAAPSSECKGTIEVTKTGVHLDYPRIMAIIGFLTLSAYLLRKHAFRYRVYILIGSIIVLGFIIPTCTCDFVLIQTVFGVLLGKIALMAGLSLLILFLIISAFTLGFGRFYCGWICPLGAVQELANRLTNKEVLSYKWKRRLSKIRPFMLIAAIIGILVGVWIPGPTINYYKYHNLLILGLTIGLAVISLFTYRPWCNYICPFGYVLAFLHKIAPYKIKLDGPCHTCNICGLTCKNAAIVNGKIDDFLCIECGDCVGACPVKSLKHTRVGKIKLTHSRES